MTVVSPPVTAGPSGLQARPLLTGSFGMAASTHWLASATAQSVLERGGNAFDAAVAAGFVLHMVEPHLNGPGGDMVALISIAGRRPQVLMGQGPAPRAATIDAFRAEGLAAVPGSGALAAAVPGAVEAWLILLRDHGTWEFREVVDYAISYAEGGHCLLGQAAGMIGVVADLFRDHWPTSAALWMPNGRPPYAGEVVYNKPYAATLRELVRQGEVTAGTGSNREDRIEGVRLAWRSGFVANAIADFVRCTPHRHSTGTVHRGVIDRLDMAGFEAGYEEPVSCVFRGTEVFKAAAWSSGPVLLQALQILSGYDDGELDLSRPRGIHLVVEAMKLAMADREAFYGEGLAPRQLAILLSEEYAAGRRELISDFASHDVRPGMLVGEVPYLPQLSESDGTVGATTGAGEPTTSRAGETRGDTCHLDIIDRWGNVISATPSGGWLQSSPAIPELGFCLGTRLQMAWLDERSPSALLPGARPRTTLSPTMLGRDGQVVTALGTPGGDQQDQWQLPFLIRTLIGGASAQAAIEAPTFHTTGIVGSFWPRTWSPGGLVVEDRVNDEVIAELEDQGHVVERSGEWSLGRLSSVERDPATGTLYAAANPRGSQGYAAGR